MIDSITSVFDLKESEVEVCVEQIKNKTHHYYIKLRNTGGRCLKCGTYTRKIKEYRKRTITHSIFLNEKAVIHYSARRFICPECGSTFFESNPFTSDYSNVSDKTVKNTLDLLKNYNETFSSVARKVDLSVSEVIRIFDQHVQPKRSRLSKCVGIDEFYFSRKAAKKYALMILSLDKGYVIDLRRDRIKSHLSSYFRNIPNEEKNIVQYISIDLNENYRELAEFWFPSAKVCADPYHVIKIINNALNEIRLTVMRRYASNKRSDEYYLLKYQRDLLFTDVSYDTFHTPKKNHHFRYHISDASKLDMMLDLSTNLKEAYHLKEQYMYFNSTDMDDSEREEFLDVLIREFIASEIPEMMSVGLTLSNWKKEILNSFDTYTRKDKKGNRYTTRVTSGPVEGRNKYIKIILKLANGYSNFDRFRNRALYVLNKRQGYSETVIANPVAKKKLK